MKKQIIPNIGIDNTKLLGMIENIHYYRNTFRRFRNHKKEFEIESQYITTYEILITKDNVKFFLGYDDRIKDNVETELNICWKNATFKSMNNTPVVGKTKELDLEEHYFLSLHTDLRGEYPLSNLLESQNILRDNEQILIRLELEPVSPTWYKEIEHHIEVFNKKGKIPSKKALDPSTIALKGVEVALDVVYTGIDFINDMITNEKIEHEHISDTRYSKLIRNGLSRDTQNKSKYNAYKTRIIVTIQSKREEMLFRNILKSFNSMTGDNKFKLVNKGDNKNILSSKEIAQIMQMPTKIYQQIYKVNNVDTREIEVPRALDKGHIKIGTIQYKGLNKMVKWPIDKNIAALPIMISGPQNAGKTTYIKRFCKESNELGYSNIYFDYIEHCDNSTEVAEVLSNKVIIRLGNKDNIPALAFNEISKIISEDMDPWDREKYANILAEQVEYLINSVTTRNTGELTAPMLRYLHSACMVTFIKRNTTINDVFNVLRKWDVRNEFIRYAKYSKIFESDDDIFYDLEELHERDKDGRIIGTRESFIVGIINRIVALKKNPYLKAMLKADINDSYDFEKWIKEGKSIFIQIPQTEFPNPKTKDILCTFFMSRIWLVVQLRQDNKHARLCKVIFDEVHQVPTCANFINNHLTEFRRHRLGLVVTCHYFKQFGKLFDAVKSAGTSYMLFTGTEKENLMMLQEELKPFTVEEGLNLKPWQSLNIINFGNQYTRFISKLPKEIKNNRFRT